MKHSGAGVPAGFEEMFGDHFGGAGDESANQDGGNKKRKKEKRASGGKQQKNAGAKRAKHPLADMMGGGDDVFGGMFGAMGGEYSE